MKKIFNLSVLTLVFAAMLAACGGGGGGGGKSNNANLSGLTVSDGALSPAFTPDTTSYAVEVAAGVASISVTPTAESGKASITVNGAAVASGAASGDITLNTGSNTITIIVTAEDGTTTKTYTVTVTKLAALSNNANLASLTLSHGTLAPAFSANTTGYSVEVQYTVASITVTPTAAGVNASITVNGTAVSSGSASDNIALSTGQNMITIIVTAEDGTTTKTYTVTVTKLAEPSHNANLAGLTLSQGTLSPDFISTTTSYSAEVQYNIASLTVTPTAAGVGASITVNGTTVSSGSQSGNITLNIGANTITVVVTAQDGTTTKTYTITVTKLEPSHNASLSGLILSQGTLSVFSSATMTYTAEVPYGTASITVTPTAAGVNASITVNGTPVSSGTATNITLNTGANTITVVVTAEDSMSQKTYTVTATVKASVIDLPRTGQTTCYDAAGAEIICGTTTGQGQDGALRKGVAWPSPRFTDNTDGTVTDNLTGLMWLQDANCIQTQYPAFDGGAATGDGTAGDGRVTWQHALDFVAGINAGTYSNCGGGHNDWRLPNRKELRSLVDYSKSSSPVLPTGHPFTNVQTDHYWSSSTDAASNSKALFVNMGDGWVSLYSKATDDCVWPVRSGQGAYASADLPRTGQATCYDAAGAVISCATTTGQDGALQTGVAWPESRFTVASSGTGTVVTDNLTGLMWAGDPTLTAPCSGVTTTAWQGALDYVACLNDNSYLEHNDWRLPNVNELESLLHAEYTKETTCSGACTTNAAWLNSLGFSKVQAADYWSSSTYAYSKSYAWIVNMQTGYVPAYIKTNNYRVWPVRGGQ